MWWPYRFRDAGGAGDPAERVRAFAAAIAGADDGWVEATARSGNGGIDVWFRSGADPSGAAEAWREGLRAHGLAAERLKGRN